MASRSDPDAVDNFRDIMAETVRNAINDVLESRAADCKLKCGLNCNEHFQSHRKIEEFFTSMSEAGKTIRETALKMIVTFLLMAAVAGVGVMIWSNMNAKAIGTATRAAGG